MAALHWSFYLAPKNPKPHLQASKKQKLPSQLIPHHLCFLLGT
ncbi:hypothetical protein VCHENC02_0776A, partial [Vibrio harveyi]